MRQILLLVKMQRLVRLVRAGLSLDGIVYGVNLRILVWLVCFDVCLVLWYKLLCILVFCIVYRSLVWRMFCFGLFCCICVLRGLSCVVCLLYFGLNCWY